VIWVEKEKMLQAKKQANRLEEQESILFKRDAKAMKVPRS
jgi:hypothetical protein